MKMPKQLPKVAPPDEPLEEPAIRPKLPPIDWASLVNKYLMKPEDFLMDFGPTKDNFMRMLLPDRSDNHLGPRKSNAIINVQQQTVVIDVKTLLDAIQEQMRLLQVSWNKQSDFILMGAEEYSAFSKSEYIHQFMNFKVESCTRYGEIFALPIRVCPHITGFCIVPKEERW